MRRSQIYGFLVTLFAFGFLVPYAKGLDFLDPILIVISCSIPLVFVPPMVAPDQPAGRLRSRIVGAIVYASVLSILIAVNGLVTVNLMHRVGQVLIPPSGLLAGVLTADVAAASFLALLSGWMLHAMPAARARFIVRIAFFALLLVYVYLSRFAPENIREAFDRGMTTEALTRNAWIMSAALVVADVALWRRAVREPTAANA